ncbi:hypothetical protein KM043_004702 [Ampulex compressa]|nr:hypothetical protein KM043_004702 [Ampulex compressa]
MAGIYHTPRERTRTRSTKRSPDGDQERAPSVPHDGPRIPGCHRDTWSSRILVGAGPGRSCGVGSVPWFRATIALWKRNLGGPRTELVFDSELSKRIFQEGSYKIDERLSFVEVKREILELNLYLASELNRGILGEASCEVAEESSYVDVEGGVLEILEVNLRLNPRIKRSFEGETSERASQDFRTWKIRKKFCIPKTS